MSIKTLKTNCKWPAILPCFAITILSWSSSAPAAPVFTYDWSTASASASGIVLDNDTVGGDNNDNWVNIAGTGNGSTDVVRNSGQPAFFSGNYYQSTGVSTDDDIYERANDGNFSYSIPSDAVSVSMSFLLNNFSGGGAARVGLRDIGFTNPFNFGIFGSTAWGVREADGDVITHVATGAATLDSTARTYRARFTIDMTPAGSMKTVDMAVDNLSDGGSETIFSDLVFNVTTLTDPSLWDGLYLRVSGNNPGTYADDLTITYSVVPLPAALPLFGVGIAGLFGFGMRFRG